MQYSYNDGLKNAGRTPKLWIVHRGQVHTFMGSAIPGVVAVTSTSYQKNGKWSNTTYHLELAEDATPCYLLAPMHGQVWPENDRMVAYERFMREFGATLSFESFDIALRRDYPRSRARMIEGEKATESLDTSGSGEAEMVEISTCKSCNRNPHTDVRIVAPDGRFWVIAHEAAEAEIPGVCKLIEIKQTPGYRGGTTTLVFAVAKGVKVQGEYYPKDSEAHQWALGRDGNGQPPPKVEGISKLMAKFGSIPRK